MNFLNLPCAFIVRSRLWNRVSSTNPPDVSKHPASSRVPVLCLQVGFCEVFGGPDDLV